MRLRSTYLILTLIFGCDSGLEPPDEGGFGRIEGHVEYVGQWPHQNQLHDLRFVGMRFIPRDTTDFLQLNQMVISSVLAFNVDSDTFFIEDAMVGEYVYSGIALRTSDDLLSWRPVGLYEDTGGRFTVRPGETVSLSMTVDFDNPPHFPPS